MNNYRQNVFEKLPNLEALDGYNAEGSECSFEANEEVRMDNDEFQDNKFCGSFFDAATNALRKGSDSGDESVDDGEEDGESESDGSEVESSDEDRETS